jgi:hypothetical protein
MRTQTRTKGRSCTGKQRHATDASARAHRRRLISEGADPDRITVYGPCRFCGCWHVGHIKWRRK